MAKRKPQPVLQPQASARQSIEILTVAWMLAVFTTLACELGFAATRGYLLATDGPPGRLGALVGMLLFAALVVGLVAIGLGMVVIRQRRPAPPQGIVVFSMVVGALPIVAVVLRLMEYL